MDDEARITRALRLRGATMLCPACNFALRGPIRGYRIVRDDGKAVDDTAGMRVSVYGCGNCGYLRFHSANVIDDTTG